MMKTIEIDFDVHRAIEAERRGFHDTPNAVLRRMLQLGPAEPEAGFADAPMASLAPPEHAWIRKGVELPQGTELRLSYAGVEARGQVAEGRLNFAGASYRSPSPAVASAVETARGDKVQVNGWKHMDARRPGDDRWIPLDELRMRDARRQDGDLPQETARPDPVAPVAPVAPFAPGRDYSTPGLSETAAPWPVAKTGEELVAFLRSSPLDETDFVVERDRATGRSADFE